MAGRGFDMAVIVSRKSVPMRVLIAKNVSKVASRRPIPYPISSTCVEMNARSMMVPLTIPAIHCRAHLPIVVACDLFNKSVAVPLVEKIAAQICRIGDALGHVRLIPFRGNPG